MSHRHWRIDYLHCSCLALEAELATLVPILGSIVLDLHACHTQRLIKHKREGKYYLVVNNKVIKSDIPLFPTNTDVQVVGNWLYDLTTNEDVEVVRMDIGADGGGDTNEELDRREQHSLEFTHHTCTLSPDHPTTLQHFPLSITIHLHTCHNIILTLMQVRLLTTIRPQNMIIMPLGMRSST